jgi:hypothetical protein
MKIRCHRILPGLVFFVFITSGSTLAQTSFRLDFNQPEKLSANAGPDETIQPGASVTLGGNPTASGGTGNLGYLWQPGATLNHVDVANPLASPVTNTSYVITVSDENGCTGKDTVRISIYGISGTNSTEQVIAFDIYPNPNNGSFVLSSPDFNTGNLVIHVISLTGKVIFTETIESFSGQKIIDFVSVQPSKGYYIIRISGTFGNSFKSVSII